MIAALACLLPGLHLPPSPDGELDGRPGLPWLLAFAVGVVALLFVWKRSNPAPAWLLLFWTLALGFTPSLERPPDFFDLLLSGNTPDTALELVLFLAAMPARMALLFVALITPWLIVAKVTLSAGFRGWFGSECEALAGYLPRAHRAKGWNRVWPVLLALVLFSLWRFIGKFFVLGYLYELRSTLGILSKVEVVVVEVLTLCPFAFCAGLILWLWYERLTIDRGGVRLWVFRPRYSLFFAPWDRIRSIALVEHDRGARSAVIRYRSRFLMPFSLGVHAKRYVNGEAAIDELIEMAKQCGVPIRRWLSPCRIVALGWSMIALGPLLLIGQQLASVWLMRGFDDPEFPTHVDRLAGLFPLTALHAASILFVGLGFGMLSAHHRGGSRPVLLTLLMIATLSFPDPIIHWLVWIAIYAILAARIGPITPLPAAPNPAVWQWELAFNVLLFGPAFAALGYYVGVTLGRRPARGPLVAG